MKSNLFNASCSAIEKKYQALDYKIGWRFLTTGKATFCDTTNFALITMNPGGDRDPPDHPHASQEAGSAYLVERWGTVPGQSKLQRQVQELFRSLHTRVAPNEQFKNFVNEQVLSTHFIPFRSPTYKQLAHKEEANQFAEDLWSGILQEILPKLIFVMDKNTCARLSTLFEKHLGGTRVRHEIHDTGWGKIKSEVMQFDLIGRKHSSVTLVRFPHLSRFTLMGKEKYRPFVDHIMDRACLTLN